MSISVLTWGEKFCARLKIAVRQLALSPSFPTGEEIGLRVGTAVGGLDIGQLPQRGTQGLVDGHGGLRAPSTERLEPRSECDGAAPWDRYEYST